MFDAVIYGGGTNYRAFDYTSGIIVKNKLSIDHDGLCMLGDMDLQGLLHLTNHMSSCGSLAKENSRLPVPGSAW